MCFVFLIRVDCLCALKLMKIYPKYTKNSSKIQSFVRKNAVWIEKNAQIEPKNKPF